MSVRSLVRCVQWITLAVIVAALLWAASWRLSGNHWERVETASMGTVAPLGTLLWVEPTHFDALKVGDFITFHPPGERGQTYSHLVHQINADGTIRTKGAITSPDPWSLTSADVVGKVTMSWKGVGWLVRAAPLLLVGAVIVSVVVRQTRNRRWKIPLGIVGAALVLSLAILVYRPLVSADQLSFAPVAGGARATYVSTGLLPVRVQAHDGAQVVLGPGEVGSVTVMQKDDAGEFAVSLHPRLRLWWWIVLVLLCFVPALWSAAIGRVATSEPRHAIAAGDAGRV